jgi:hypothetical protein
MSRACLAARNFFLLFSAAESVAWIYEDAARLLLLLAAGSGDAILED